MRVGGQFHAPAALPPGKKPCTHCIGRWVGAENLTATGIRSPTVQPVASRYTDYAIPSRT
jgi:hypothetical protein